MRYPSRNVTAEHERTRRYLESFSVCQPAIISSPDGAVMMTKSTFAPFEGEITASPYVKIGINIGPPGWYSRRSAVAAIDGAWRRNGVVVTLPDEVSQGRSSGVTMLGLAVDLSSAPLGDTPVRADALARAASRHAVDAYAAALMTTLWMSSELHGASTAFFEHGLGELLRHLSSDDRARRGTQRVRALDAARLGRVDDFIDARLPDDVSVGDLAGVAAMDPSAFTKAFQAATGFTPFAYLTRRRMEKAKMLLLGGETVTRAALAVGYANPSKFSAAFRRCVGCSPTEWLCAR